MSKVTSLEKARIGQATKETNVTSPNGFVPCSQDMTICGDCEGNRARKKCPRLKEWLRKGKGDR